MDWIMGAVVVLLVIVSGLVFARSGRLRPQHLVSPSPVAGWDDALARMPRGPASPVVSLDQTDVDLADTETAAVSAKALPPLSIDFDLELDASTQPVPAKGRDPLPGSGEQR